MGNPFHRISYLRPRYLETDTWDRGGELPYTIPRSTNKRNTESKKYTFYQFCCYCRMVYSDDTPNLLFTQFPEVY